MCFNKQKAYENLYHDILLSFTLFMAKAQRNEILVPDVKTIQVIANGDWMAPPIVSLNPEDYLEISFDELTHQYHRYIYKITHCNADWSPSGLSEIEYLNGFNNNTIDDYKNSFNTTMQYTHYKLFLPNDDVQITASGNYILTVYDDNENDKPILNAVFLLSKNK